MPSKKTGSDKRERNDKLKLNGKQYTLFSYTIMYTIALHIFNILHDPVFTMKENKINKFGIITKTI